MERLLRTHRLLLAAFLMGILCLGAVWAALALTAAPAAAGETPASAPDTVRTAAAAPQPSLGPSDFGLAFVNSAENPSSTARIQRGVTSGATMDRFPLYWDRIEASRGFYSWSEQDAAILANQAQGLGTLAILLGTPGYYAGAVGAAGPATPLRLGGSFPDMAGSVRARAGCSPHEGPRPPTGLWNPVFADGSDLPGAGKQIHPDNPWARFVHAAVSRYMPGGSAGTGVRHWEIWNEPDLCHFWSGTPQEYARLLKVAYLAAKQADPDSFILWGGLAHFADGEWLYAMVDALLNDPMAAEYDGFFDAAASHHYSLSYLGYQYTQKIRSALASRGYTAKPIWITESGVPICDDYPGPACPSPWRATPLEQAAYVWQNVAYTRLAGGGPIFHFMLHDDCGNVVAVESPDGFGLVKNESSSFCSPANAEPRLAYRAFQLANQFFTDTELVWADIAQGRVRRVAFYHPDTNERRLLTWSIVTTGVTATIPAAGLSARQIELDGSERTLTAQEGVYTLPLSGATNLNWPNDEGGYDVGIYGVPSLLVEPDELPPVATIQPLPPFVAPNFTVHWSAQDWGSGVEYTALWVQADGEPWQLWRDHAAPRGSAGFSGSPGRAYTFPAHAADRAGHRLESFTPLATTRVVTDSQVSGQVVDPAGQPFAGVLVRIGPALATSGVDGSFELSVPLGSWDVTVGGRIYQHGRAFAGPQPLRLLHAPNGNSVANGDFEAGLTGWQVSGSSPLAAEKQPHSQDHALRLATAFVPNPGVPGSEGSDGGNSTLSQQIWVPRGDPHLALTYQVQSQETEPDQDRFEVILAAEGEPAHYLLTQHLSSDWQLAFFDLAPFAGRQVQLILNVYETSPNRRTSALVDQLIVSDVTRRHFAPERAVFLPVNRR